MSRYTIRTYLELMARATAGEYGDKQWAMMLGERNSGKGLLQEMNLLAFGPYVGQCQFLPPPTVGLQRCGQVSVMGPRL